MFLAYGRAGEGSMHYREKWFYVYIMTNRSKTLYVGITSGLVKRVLQHRNGVFEGFTSRYKIDRLVYWEKFKSVTVAIAREKQLKGWTESRRFSSSSA